MPENSFDMSSKTAIVIGATQGMGAQIAETLRRAAARSSLPVGRRLRLMPRRKH